MKKASRVQLFVRIRVDGRQKYVRPVVAANGVIRSSWAWVGGGEQRHPEARYVLRYRALSGRRVWETIGQDAAVAMAARVRKERELIARENAQAAGLEITGDSRGAQRFTIEEAVAEYLHDCKIQKAAKTYAGRRRTLTAFVAGCRKQYIDEITRRDLLDHIALLKSRNLAARTIFNRIEAIGIFLRGYGVKGLLARADLPRYTERTVSAYSGEEVRALLASAHRNQRLVLEFFLATGAREQEVQFAAWTDINFNDGTFSVTSKPDLGFTPKDYEERIIPIPDTLVCALRGHQRLSEGRRLIFENEQGGAEGHFLRKLKKLALRAGLNCGHCLSKSGLSCASHAVCRSWSLHKFRRTFATMHHESGVSARTLQAWLGHSDLETTLAYLQIADMRSPRTREQVNKSFACFA